LHPSVRTMVLPLVHFVLDKAAYADHSSGGVMCGV
jgi:hypothetical protein